MKANYFFKGIKRITNEEKWINKNEIKDSILWSKVFGELRHPICPKCKGLMVLERGTHITCCFECPKCRTRLEGNVKGLKGNRNFFYFEEFEITKIDKGDSSDPSKKKKGI